MQIFVIGAIVVYFLPLGLLWLATFATAFFEGVLTANQQVAEPTLLYMVAGISGDVLGTIRDMFGALLVPLVMAYAISTPAREQPVPLSTLCLFVAFILLFAVSFVQVGLIDAKEAKLLSLGISEEEAQSLYQMARSFTTDSLTYAALLLGITVKRN